MTMLHSNIGVVQQLLSRFALTSAESVQQLQRVLTDALRLSMQHTACYAKIPVEQALPAEAGVDANSLAGYVHPENIAAALHSLNFAVSATPGAPAIDLPADVQVYTSGSWSPVGAVTSHPVPVDLRIPAPAPQPVAPPPAPIPAPPAPTLAPAPQATSDLIGLVNAALADPPAVIAPSTVPATPSPVTAVPAPAPAPVPQPAAPEQLQAQFPQGVQTVAELDQYRAATGHPAAQQVNIPLHPSAPITDATGAVVDDRSRQGMPTNAQGVPGPAHVTLAQAKAEQHLAPMEGLPTADVLADRTGASGRPTKSPFERPVEARSKVGKPPFWWEHLLFSANRVFTHNPAAALDDKSTGSGPMQAYAILVQLLDKALRGADPTLNVAQLREFLREVDAGMSALPSRDAIYQIADEVFSVGK